MKRIAWFLAALLAYVGLALGAVNINSATQEQLESLNGIGPVKAKAIIDYRQKNGRFKTLEEVKNVSGIGDATFEKIRNDIMLTGTTTVVKDEKPAATKAAEKKETVREKAAEKKETVREKASEKKATAQEPTADKKEKVKEKVADTKEKVKEKTADTKAAVKEKAADAKAAVKEK